MLSNNQMKSLRCKKKKWIVFYAPFIKPLQWNLAAMPSFESSLCFTCSLGHITVCFGQSFFDYMPLAFGTGLQLKWHNICLLWFISNVPKICLKRWGKKHRLAFFPVSHHASVLLQCQEWPVGGSSDACLLSWHCALYPGGTVEKWSCCKHLNM